MGYARRPKRRRSPAQLEVFTTIQTHPDISPREIRDLLDYTQVFVASTLGIFLKEKSIIRAWSAADKCYRYSTEKTVRQVDKIPRVSAKQMAGLRDIVIEEGWKPRFVHKGDNFVLAITRLWECTGALAAGEKITNKELHDIKQLLEDLLGPLLFSTKVIQSMLDQEELWDSGTLAAFLLSFDDTESGSHGGQH